MQRYAIANGLWIGPEPEEFECFTWIERKILAEHMAYSSVARMRPQHGLTN